MAAELCPLPAESRTCGVSEFACASGRCIPGHWLCDGDRDCPVSGAVSEDSVTSEDEAEAVCRPDNLQCDADSFRCLSGRSAPREDAGEKGGGGVDACVMIGFCRVSDAFLLTFGLLLLCEMFSSDYCQALLSKSNNTGLNLKVECGSCELK